MEFKTIPHVMRSRLQSSGTNNAVGVVSDNGTIRLLTFSQYIAQATEISKFLQDMGVKKGDKIAIYGPTSLSWHLADLAIMAIGAITVPIYPNLKSEAAAEIFVHSEAIAFFSSDSLATNSLISGMKKLNNQSKPNFIVEFNNMESKVENCFSFQSILEMEKASQFCLEEGIETVNEDDVATIVYTSGTTGQPKGAVISHRALTQMMRNIFQTLHHQFKDTDRLLTFLPLSHVLGRCDSLLPLTFGIEAVYSRGIDKVTQDIEFASPTFMLAVPRIFEKIYEGVLAKVNQGSLLERNMFRLAIERSRVYFQKIDNDQAPKSREIVGRELAYNLVFKKIYKKFGGKIRFFVSGGAPLSTDIMNFLRYANLPILEGYGLTETIAPCFLNPIRKQIPGTVGLPLGDVQVMFAEDGEILLKTAALFTEYFNDPDSTSLCFDQDGWFKTGDIGELSVDGYLKITDRKKDILITSGGKNVAPQKIERLFKPFPLIAQVLIIGDKRKFLTALLGFEEETLRKFHQQQGLENYQSIENSMSEKKVVEAIEKILEQVNSSLDRFETIKKWDYIPEEITVESGLMTPSLKLKKKLLSRKYQDKIDSLYGGSASN